MMTTITLNSPITFKRGDQEMTVKELTLRKVKVKDMKVAEAEREKGSQFTASVALLASVTGLPIEAIEELDADDFTAVEVAMQPFLPKPPLETGGQ